LRLAFAGDFPNAKRKPSDFPVGSRKEQDRMAGRLTTMLVLCSLLAGCGWRNRELLETELRAKEIQYNELREEHERTEHYNHALEKEVAAIRQGQPISPEQASQTFTLKRITLGRMTGGLDTDNKAGDDALQVIVEPRDGADHLIKTPGTLHVLALQVDSQGIKVPLSSWDVCADDLRRSWKGGLFSSGYVVTLPWKNWPTCENLRVVARLVLSDGRAFEADKDVKVHVAPGVHPAPILEPKDSFQPDHLHMPRPFPEPQSQAPASGITPASDWQPLPLGNAAKLQAPVPWNNE
jgi:hypothetical protein